jgi:hypothetical protein
MCILAAWPVCCAVQYGHAVPHLEELTPTLTSVTARSAACTWLELAFQGSSWAAVMLLPHTIHPEVLEGTWDASWSTDTRACSCCKFSPGSGATSVEPTGSRGKLGAYTVWLPVVPLSTHTGSAK